MGWVGAGILIASACYIFYRYPLHTRAKNTKSEPSVTPQSYPESGPRYNSVAAPTREDVKKDGDTGSKTVLKGGLSTEKDSEVGKGEDGLQTTPKASPTGAPILEIPSFQLDADSNSNETEKVEGSQQVHRAPVSVAVGREEKPSSMPAPAPAPAPKADTSNPASSLMPPPPLPVRRSRQTTQQQLQRPLTTGSTNNNTPSTSAGLYPPRPTSNSNTSRLQPPPSTASSLRAPRNNRPTSNSSLSPPTLLAPKPQKNSSRRVLLEPGYSPLDWAALTSNPHNSNKLRGINLPPHLIKVTPSVLKAQNGRKGMDAWTSFQGKVYNITPYLPFHPGGKGELMRGAGRDSGKLFMEIHPWVNWDAMLGECLVGILVSEHEGQEDGLDSNKLDAMD